MHSPKRKRNNLAESFLRPTLIPDTAGDIEQEALIDDLIKTIGNLGFKQILPSPVEERMLYMRDPRLLREFGTKIVELEQRTGELVLCPTYFLSIFKRYAKNASSRGPHIAKWFYLTPTLEFSENHARINHELGIFILGEDSSLAMAQLINTASQIFTNLGINGHVVEVNSLGCTTCQKDYQNLLQEHLRRSKYELCDDCNTNLEGNPIMVWSCRNSSCQTLLASAPQMVDFLDQSCRNILVGLLETIDELGVSYTLNSALSLPLNPEKVQFRITVQDGREIVGEGGNYSYLTSILEAGSELPLLGFLTTFEKLWHFVPEEHRKLMTHVEVFMVPLGEVACRRALLLHRELQQAGIVAAESIVGHGGIKNQLKEAIEKHSDITLIIGQKEALEDTVILRDMRSGIQEVFAYDRIIEEVKKRLGK